MIKLFKKLFEKSRRTRATKKWIEDTDPIKMMTYYILMHVKVLLIALIVYIFVLTISEMVFTFDNATSIAKGSFTYNKYYDQHPKRNI